MEIVQIATDYWGLIFFCLTVFTGYVLWNASKQFVSKKEFEKDIEQNKKFHEAQDRILEDLSKKLIELTTTMQNLPNIQTLHKMELGIEELRGQIKAQSEQIRLITILLDDKNANKKHS